MSLEIINQVAAGKSVAATQQSTAQLMVSIKLATPYVVVYGDVPNLNQVLGSDTMTVTFKNDKGNVTIMNNIPLAYLALISGLSEGVVEYITAPESTPVVGSLEIVKVLFPVTLFVGLAAPILKGQNQLVIEIVTAKNLATVLTLEPVIITNQATAMEYGFQTIQANNKLDVTDLDDLYFIPSSGNFKSIEILEGNRSFTYDQNDLYSLIQMSDDWTSNLTPAVREFAYGLNVSNFEGAIYYAGSSESTIIYRR